MDLRPGAGAGGSLVRGTGGTGATPTWSSPWSSRGWPGSCRAGVPRSSRNRRTKSTRRAFSAAARCCRRWCSYRWGRPLSALPPWLFPAVRTPCGGHDGADIAAPVHVRPCPRHASGAAALAAVRPAFMHEVMLLLPGGLVDLPSPVAGRAILLGLLVALALPAGLLPNGDRPLSVALRADVKQGIRSFQRVSPLISGSAALFIRVELFREVEASRSQPPAASGSGDPLELGHRFLGFGEHWSPFVRLGR